MWQPPPSSLLPQRRQLVSTYPQLEAWSVRRCHFTTLLVLVLLSVVSNTAVASDGGCTFIPGFIASPDVEHMYDDLDYRPDLGVVDLANLCSSDDRCTGFNDIGYVKSIVIPTSPSLGTCLYVRVFPPPPSPLPPSPAPLMPPSPPSPPPSSPLFPPPPSPSPSSPLFPPLAPPLSPPAPVRSTPQPRPEFPPNPPPQPPNQTLSSPNPSLPPSYLPPSPYPPETAVIPTSHNSHGLSRKAKILIITGAVCGPIILLYIIALLIFLLLICCVDYEERHAAPRAPPDPPKPLPALTQPSAPSRTPASLQQPPAAPQGGAARSVPHPELAPQQPPSQLPPTPQTTGLSATPQLSPAPSRQSTPHLPHPQAEVQAEPSAPQLPLVQSSAPTQPASRPQPIAPAPLPQQPTAPPLPLQAPPQQPSAPLLHPSAPQQPSAPLLHPSAPQQPSAPLLHPSAPQQTPPAERVQPSAPPLPPSAPPLLPSLAWSSSPAQPLDSRQPPTAAQPPTPAQPTQPEAPSQPPATPRRPQTSPQSQAPPPSPTVAWGETSVRRPTVPPHSPSPPNLNAGPSQPSAAAPQLPSAQPWLQVAPVQQVPAVRPQQDSIRGSPLIGQPSINPVNICLREYTLEVLKKATNNFALKNKIGEGRSGPVYRGCLGPQKQPVAIKKVDLENSQGWSEFLAEVDILSGSHHPHILMLLGTCSDQGILVYELMPGGSLASYLNDNKRPSSQQQRQSAPPAAASATSSRAELLSWRDRVRIMWQVASALYFLHTSNPPIVHRDLKPDNILLDEHKDAKLGDVGLARALKDPGISVNITANMEGTLGYIDPEYHHTGAYGPRSDIYALGMCMLQVLTNASSYQGLVKRVRTALARNDNAFQEMLSAMQAPLEETQAFARLALRCTKLVGSRRPSMQDILAKLTRLKEQTEAREVPVHPPDGGQGSQQDTEAEEPPERFLCPITLDVMNDPVVASDGNTYERIAIVKSMERDTRSPITRARLDPTILIVNNGLRSEILEWRERMQRRQQQ
ncbi:hypothetical protein Agub_g13302 [Astrephomene gubernaculifera]|uniref:RING-type E3 ubiquitin transferase n=1 Tax=Astrephomene gubernaculifera TaxID=47775 RepID=A0AAD3HS87_9CHLO|nr:hypothetical protein Agub_g13302 [Astrephomene gubernaculifera]